MDLMLLFLGGFTCGVVTVVVLIKTAEAIREDERDTFHPTERD